MRDDCYRGELSSGVERTFIRMILRQEKIGANTPDIIGRKTFTNHNYM